MAKHRGPPWSWIGAIFALVCIGGVSAGVWGFGGSAKAPEDAGVCWRATMKGDKPSFQRLAGDVPNLESCAAHLEALFLRYGGEISGAYQGRYLFVDEKAIRSAKNLDGSRWQVFFAPQRAALDQRLRQGGKTPSLALMPAR